jgi:hypothetical protein
MLYVVFNKGIENYYLTTNGTVQAGWRVFQTYSIALEHAIRAGVDFKVYGVLADNKDFAVYDDMPQPNCVLLNNCPIVFVEDELCWNLQLRDTQVDVYDPLLDKLGVIPLSTFPQHIQTNLQLKGHVRVKLVEF